MFTPEMDTIKDQIKALTDLVPVINAVKQKLEASPRDLDLIADVTFLVRKTEQIFEAVGKRLHEIESLAALNYHNLLPILEEKAYRNDNCTISDNTDFYVQYPASPEKPGYKEFIELLPKEAMRPHYPAVCDLITKTVAEGEQVPFGLNRTGLVVLKPKLRMTGKKEL